jgi:hypothetical protein
VVLALELHPGVDQLADQLLVGVDPDVAAGGVVVVVRPLGTAVVEEVAVSRTTVLSRPRNRAKSTRRIRTATARIPRTPPGKLVVVVVVVVASVVRVAVPVVVWSVVPVVVGVWGAAVCAVASVPVCGVVTLPVAAGSDVPGVLVFWA